MQPETKSPVMDVAPPPKAEPAKTNLDDTKKIKTDLKTEPAKSNDKATKPKATIEKSGSSAATAIFVTIVIMLLLAGLAVYAYLKSK